MKYVLAPVALALCCAQADAGCPEKPNDLAATYNVTTRGADNTETRYDLRLWRQQDRVAHQYPARQITHVWERAANGALHLERHFDAFEKGIEYQPLDINRGRGENDWSLKYQLVSDSLIARMTPVGTPPGDCDSARTYTLDGDKEYRLSWLPGRHLVESFEVRSPTGTTTWTLAGVDTDGTAVAEFFDRHSRYQLTDYADIGDNEADPFISRMIHLGFIDHGASGFYDENGKAMEHRH